MRFQKNIEQLPDIVQIAVDMRIDRLRFTPLSTRGYTHLNGLALSNLDRANIISVLDKANKIIEGTSTRILDYVTASSLLLAENEMIDVNDIQNAALTVGMNPRVGMSPRSSFSALLSCDSPELPEFMSLLLEKYNRAKTSSMFFSSDLRRIFTNARGCSARFLAKNLAVSSRSKMEQEYRRLLNEAEVSQFFLAPGDAGRCRAAG